MAVREGPEAARGGLCHRQARTLADGALRCGMDLVSVSGGGLCKKGKRRGRTGDGQRLEERAVSGGFCRRDPGPSHGQVSRKRDGSDLSGCGTGRWDLHPDRRDGDPGRRRQPGQEKPGRPGAGTVFEKPGHHPCGLCRRKPWGPGSCLGP